MKEKCFDSTSFVVGSGKSRDIVESPILLADKFWVRMSERQRRFVDGKVKAGESKVEIADKTLTVFWGKESIEGPVRFDESPKMSSRSFDRPTVAAASRVARGCPFRA